MKLCSVTIWYNPDDSCVKNILTYSSSVEKCFIVDNSAFDNSVLALKIPNAVYIANMDNFGIAKALNIGCEKAFSDGFEWCMTMDQDSRWDSQYLKKYFEIIQSNISERNVSFAPIFTNHETGNDVIKVNKCITSGNVIKLTVWSSIGKFYEPFFIDEVDFEFCFRLKEHGYDVLQIQSVYMVHHLGDCKKHILPLLCHSGIRIYYMIRNAMFIKNMHPEFYKIEKYASWVRYFSFRIVVEGILRFKFSNLKYLLRAEYDFKKNRLGKY